MKFRPPDYSQEAWEESVRALQRCAELRHRRQEREETKMSFEIITREECPLCEQVKELFCDKEIVFTEKVIDKDISREMVLLQFPFAKTVPLIVEKETNMWIETAKIKDYLAENYDENGDRK